jgi:two-component system sensor histidine kinase AlgZ
MKATTPIARERAEWLPDLCAPAATLPLVLIAALVALAFAAALTRFVGFWPEFGRLALLSEVLTLASAAGLCALRRAFGGRDRATLLVPAFVLLAAIAWIVAEAAYYILAAYGESVPQNARDATFWMLRIVLIALIADALVLRYLYVSAEWRERVRREAADRLDALTARIRPHFLFNTLNTAAALVAEQPAAAERTLEDLSELFRANLEERAPRIPLGEEVALVRRYLAIERRRLGERLRVNWDLEPGSEDALIPPLLLQPLVENAVTHGVEPSAAGGRLVIRTRRAGRRLEIAVENPMTTAGEAGHGIGLAGVRARLAVAFGDQATLALEETRDRFVAQVLCPWQTASRDDAASGRSPTLPLQAEPNEDAHPDRG